MSECIEKSLTLIDNAFTVKCAGTDGISAKVEHDAGATGNGLYVAQTQWL